MDKKGMMSVETSEQTMWTLSPDRKSVRFAVPPLPIAGMPEPISVPGLRRREGRRDA